MAPRPEPPAAVLAAPLPVVANSAPAIVETVAPTAIAPLTLCHAQPVVENRTVVLIDPMSTGVILQKRVFSLGYRVILVWSDRTQPASHEKHFERSGFSKEDFAAVIVHEAESGIEDTVASILAVATDIAAVMCGSEHGVLLEDAIAQGLRKALAASHINGSGLAQTTLKVDKHAQANIIRSAGLAAVHELLAYTEEDVHKFLETASDSDSFVVKPQTGAGSVGVTFCGSKQSVLDDQNTLPSSYGVGLTDVGLVPGNDAASFGKTKMLARQFFYPEKANIVILFFSVVMTVSNKKCQKAMKIFMK